MDVGLEVHDDPAAVLLESQIDGALQQFSFLDREYERELTVAPLGSPRPFQQRVFQGEAHGLDGGPSLLVGHAQDSAMEPGELPDLRFAVVQVDVPQQRVDQGPEPAARGPGDKLFNPVCNKDLPWESKSSYEFCYE